MKERTVAPWNQHIVYLCCLFWYHINPPSNRCSSRDFLCCLLSRMAAVSISFLSRLTRLPAPIAALSSSSSRWWSPAAACGVLRRRGTHRTAFEVFCPCDSASRQLGQLRRGGTPVQPRALSPANLRIDSPPSRLAFQTVPGHPEADEAGCCVDIAGLGETGVDGQFQLRRGGRSPVQPCTPSPANVRTHSPPSRSTHQSIPDH